MYNLLVAYFKGYILIHVTYFMGSSDLLVAYFMGYSESCRQSSIFIHYTAS